VKPAPLSVRFILAAIIAFNVVRAVMVGMHPTELGDIHVDLAILAGIVWWLVVRRG
jgi:hypothetical protein